MTGSRVARPHETDERVTLLAHLHMERVFTAKSIEYREPMADVPDRQVDIPKLRRGGVNCIWLSEGAPGEFTVDPTPALHACEQPEHRAVPADLL